MDLSPLGTGKFSTLPDRDGQSEMSQACRFVVFSLHGLGHEAAEANNRGEIEDACSAVLAAKPDFCVALGRPSTPTGAYLPLSQMFPIQKPRALYTWRSLKTVGLSDIHTTPHRAGSSACRTYTGLAIISRASYCQYPGQRDDLLPIPMNLSPPLEGTIAGGSLVREDFDDLQKTAARIPALARLLQTNGFLTASGVVSKAAIKKSVNGSASLHAKVDMRATGALTPPDAIGPLSLKNDKRDLYVVAGLSSHLLN